MNVQFEKTSPVVGELTLTFDKADYQERVTKALKDYRKKAQMPGFRPGQVPMSLLQKRFGTKRKEGEEDSDDDDLNGWCYRKY